MGYRSDDLLMENDQCPAQKKRTEQSPSRRQGKQIDVLFDDILLEIFDFYVNMGEGKAAMEAWQTLVHVCRRWRSLVLGSPRRLNLRLFCTPKTPARDKLDIWPALPLIIQAGLISLALAGMDNIIAALGQSNRVCKAELYYGGDREWETLLAVMQVLFPELTDLEMVPIGRNFEPIVIPDSFLGGSAPRLRRFSLGGATFPGLPKLLLSAPHLVHLRISYPESWYFSSEAMAALLSALSSLSSLSLEFQSMHYPRPRQVRETRRQPPSNRSVIPALTSLSFYGDIQYSENLATNIDTPRLDSLHINFFDPIRSDTPRLTELVQFIDCTPALRALDEVHVQIFQGRPRVGYRTSKSGFDNFQINFTLYIRDSELSSLEHVCNSLHSRFTIEDLYMEHDYQDPWAIGGTLWLEFLLPFTAVKNLYVSKMFVPVIARTLHGLDVLPSLQNIFVEGLEPSGSFQEKIGQFVAARQLSGRCIAISVWVNLNAEYY